MKIDVLVPSRGRPQNIERLAKAFFDTTVGHARLNVIIDADDPSLTDYMEMWDRIDGHLIGSIAIANSGLRIGGICNTYGPIHAYAADVVGFMGDDHLPRTDGWDEVVANAHTSTPGAVTYGNDLLQGERLATAAFLDSRIITTLGYLAPPGAVHLFLDNFWMAIGQGLGTLRYLPDVIIEHIHPSAGKGDWDEGYLANNDNAVWSADEATFVNYMNTRYPADIAKLKAVFG